MSNYIYSNTSSGINFVDNIANLLNIEKFREAKLFDTIGVMNFFNTGSFPIQRDTRALRYVTVSEYIQDTVDAFEHVSSSVVSFSEKVNSIQKIFELNMSSLAELLNVSRPTIYAWVKGEVAKSEEHILHVDLVFNVSQKFSDLNLKRPDNFIKRPLFNKESLFSLLKSKNEIDENYLLLIKELDQKEFEVRTEGFKKEPLRTSRDVVEDFSYISKF